MTKALLHATMRLRARQKRARGLRSARARPPVNRLQGQVSTNAVTERAGDLLLARVRVLVAHFGRAEPAAVARAQLSPERDLDAGQAAVDANAVARGSVRRSAGPRRDLDVGPLRVALHDVQVLVEHVLLDGLRSQRRGDIQRRLQRRVFFRARASQLRERDERCRDRVCCFHVMRVGSAAK